LENLECESIRKCESTTDILESTTMSINKKNISNQQILNITTLPSNMEFSKLTWKQHNLNIKKSLVFSKIPDNLKLKAQMLGYYNTEHSIDNQLLIMETPKTIYVYSTKPIYLKHNIGYLPLFSNCNFTSIHLNYNILDQTSFKYMFNNCENLKEVTIDNIQLVNTNNCLSQYEICDTAQMFYECINLRKVTFSNIPNICVINARDMFCDCKKLKEIDLSAFNFGSLYSAKHMFYNCSSLQKIIFNTHGELEKKIQLARYNGYELFQSAFYNCPAYTNKDGIIL
jgi:hypothetical protein